MTNTYGIKMLGLKEASEATGGWHKNSGGYTQISYDMDTGEVLTNDHADQNNWTEYNDPAVITVCGTSEKMSEQEIADRICYHIEMIKEYL